MLTDFALRNLKPRDPLQSHGSRWHVRRHLAERHYFLPIRLRINGRRETLTIGRYSFGGISLAEARERLRNAKRLLGEDTSPALQKQWENLDLPLHIESGDGHLGPLATTGR